MNKKDLLIIIALFAIWMLWGPIDRFLIKPLFPAQSVPETVEETPPATSVLPGEHLARPSAEETPVERPPLLTEAPAAPAPAPEIAREPAPVTPEETLLLSNDVFEVTVSSHGGAIRHILLKNYRNTIDKTSGPVEFDFSSQRALAYRGLVEGGESSAFSMQRVDDRSVLLEWRTLQGLLLKRSLSLGPGYVMKIQDEFACEGNQAVTLPAYRIQTGPMHNLEGDSAMYGVMRLGVDTLSPGGEKVKYWGKQISKKIKNLGAETLDHTLHKPVEWLAAKNKYFAQSLAPADGGENASVHARKDPVSGNIEDVSGSIHFPAMVVAPETSVFRETTYYIGPKKLSELKKLRLYQSRIMELGWLTPVSEILLRSLNFIQAHIWPFNYGFAIMLLTVIIKIIFWPISHKGTESMRRMQELSPLMKEINEKYKDSPQKKQQALMALYKQHKVNPLGGCLPMLIQIPVFIGLFYVLRSAIELRFAEFLWIKDLSEPERIFEFGFTVPLLGWDAFNILPLLMTVTMFIQQKMTSTVSAAADPKQEEMQQMMMKIMPVMMLVFLYNLASGLALYWTTQNVLMIIQQMVYKKRKKAKENG